MSTGNLGLVTACFIRDLGFFTPDALPSSTLSFYFLATFWLLWLFYQVILSCSSQQEGKKEKSHPFLLKQLANSCPELFSPIDQDIDISHSQL